MLFDVKVLWEIGKSLSDYRSVYEYLTFETFLRSRRLSFSTSFILDCLFIKRILKIIAKLQVKKDEKF